MANPQKENGYTSIANEIMEALAKAKLNGSEFRMVMHTLRQTYGYGRKIFTASYSELGKATGMNRVNAKRTMDQLLSKQITRVIRSDNTNELSYGINKNYDEWCYRIREQQGVIESDNESVIESDNSEPLTPIIGNKRKKKKINKRKDRPDGSILKTYKYPDWLNMKLWSEFVEMRAKSRHPITSGTGITRLLNSLKKLINDGYPQEEIIGLSLERNWRGFFKPSETVSTGELTDAERKRREQICNQYWPDGDN